MAHLPWILAAIVAYLVGAVPFGLLVGRAWKGVDIRQHGSGNLGATNALRVLGKGVGGLVLLLDVIKGAGPVLLVAALAAEPPPWAGPLVAGAAVLGHVFPVYLGFRGGKGVATSAGALGALHPAALAVALGVFALVVAVSRWVSLGSLVASLALTAAAVALDGPGEAFGAGLPRTALFALLTVLVWIRHRANLARILRGREPRLGDRPRAEDAAPTADTRG